MKIRIAAAVIIAAVAAVPTAASAAGANAGLGGTSFTYEVSDLTVFAGKCTYAREAAGLGGGGITYHVVGVGTAGGSYRGIPVVATGIRCRLFLPTVTVTAGPEYLPGTVAETDTSYTTNDASRGAICTTIYAVLRQAPPGSTNNTIVSQERCE